jgi:DNA-binding CsgD family transcriptional regulator
MSPSIQPSSGQVLLGRQRECEELDRLLGALREGHSAALVVCGNPGVGKTALLEYVRDRASGCRVVTASAAQSEMELAFAGAHQLCAPLLERLDRLPGPQRAALSTAFGLTEGIPPDRFFLGLAVLSLLSEAAAERPLVCLVDDAQWLDSASSQVLAFVARRLVAESVALLFAAREARSELAGLPEMGLHGLSDDDARALLASVQRGPLDERVRERIIAETNGNALALLELPRGLTPTQLAGGFGDPDAGLLATRVEESFARRLAALPDETRLLLLLAAAEPLGEPVLLWRAARTLGIPPSAADAAHVAGLFEIGKRVRFRHPLVRSAVYRSGAPRDRRSAHSALADATDPQADSELRAWHRAHAAAGPTAEVAAELEHSAGRAAARGGLAAASAFLLKAAALTPEPPERARRALAAAEAERQAGDPEAALRALVTAEAGPLDSLGRARAELLRARIAFGSGADYAAKRLFDAAKQLEPIDIDLARETYLDALSATVYLGPKESCDPVEVARAALAARRAGPPRPTDLLLDGVALQLTEGYATAAETLRLALRAFASDDISADVGLGWGWLASHVASALWEHDVQVALANRHVRLTRESGAVAVLPQTLAQLIGIHMRQGELAAAAALMREVDAAVDATCSEPLAHVSMVMAAYCGHAAEGQRLIEEARTHLTPESRGLGVVVVEFANLLLNNGLGRYEDGWLTGRRVLEDLEPVGRPPWALSELVEAAARAGAVDDATAALRQLSERAGISGTEWAQGLDARSRALLTEGSDAEQLYREAIERLSRPGSRTDLARAHLVYGEWLRRAGRRVAARQELRTAYDMLSDMGVEAFADRAWRELRATGETVRKLTLETRDDLTPQEHQIARLARAGLSNPEIGARLFISPRTVEYHLHKIFIKLDISSRVALRDALPEHTAMSA